jgi:hypothetical protein
MSVFLVVFVIIYLSMGKKKREREREEKLKHYLHDQQQQIGKRKIIIQLFSFFFILL